MLADPVTDILVLVVLLLLASVLADPVTDILVLVVLLLLALETDMLEPTDTWLLALVELETVLDTQEPVLADPVTDILVLAVLVLVPLALETDMLEPTGIGYKEKNS